MKKIINRKKEASGQAVLELIVTLFGFFTIFFMFVQLALGFAVANYVQYVTFLASRAYYSAFGDEPSQKRAAEEYFTKMVGEDGGRFKGLIKVDGDGAGSFVGKANTVSLRTGEARTNSWEQGAKYKFNVKMYMLPLIRGVGQGSNNTVTLESQCFLGRETSTRECEEIMHEVTTRKGIDGMPDAIYDNGC